MDRENLIQQIIAAMTALEECSDQDIDSTKRFLRWMSDEALRDMWEKHKQALEKRTPAMTSITVMS